MSSPSPVPDQSASRRPPRIVVISLPDATKRRADSARQLRAVGLNFDFFSAVRGQKAIEDGEFEQISRTEYLRNCGREVVPGEIGCFASHRRLWQQCIDTNEPLVIMEDDFKLGAGFAHAVSVVAAFIEHAGFVRLQADLRARKTAVERCDGYTLARFTKPPHGLMCYCVSPRVARIFVAATAVMDAPVDVFAKRYWQHGQPLYALLPYTVTPSTLSFDTSIPGRIRTTKPPRVAMQRLARKLNWHCRRILYNLRYSWCDPYAASIREAGAFPARRDAKAEPESIAAGP